MNPCLPIWISAAGIFTFGFLVGVFLAAGISFYLSRKD